MPDDVVPLLHEQAGGHGAIDSAAHAHDDALSDLSCFPTYSIVCAEIPAVCSGIVHARTPSPARCADSGPVVTRRCASG